MLYIMGYLQCKVKFILRSLTDTIYIPIEYYIVVFLNTRMIEDIAFVQTWKNSFLCCECLFKNTALFLKHFGNCSLSLLRGQSHYSLQNIRSYWMHVWSSHVKKQKRKKNQLPTTKNKPFIHAEPLTRQDAQLQTILK